MFCLKILLPAAVQVLNDYAAPQELYKVLLLVSLLQFWGAVRGLPSPLKTFLIILGGGVPHGSQNPYPI